MAGLSTTQSFADGDTVTAAKLNNIIANASIDDDAVTTAKIADDAVTLAQMANNSVDTAELVDDSVSNAKLGTMLKRRVKANATDATANPTDVAIGANEVLVGTSNSLNAVSFADDLKLDNTDSSATKIVAAPGIITTKTTVSAASGDELLIYDSDDTSNLHKTTAQSIVSSTAATSSVSGSTELATSAELIGATASPANLVAGVTSVAPMLAKAYCEFTSTTGPAVPNTETVTNSHNITSVTRTATGVYSIVFTTAVPSTKYIVLATGYRASDGALLFGRITAKTTAGCTIEFGAYNNITVDADASGGATLVFYGLTS
tara:strand:+ start:1094 stop:2050 length:957 start_codon:yes stop_codon:yes gene_type:complete